MAKKGGISPALYLSLIFHLIFFSVPFAGPNYHAAAALEKVYVEITLPREKEISAAEKTGEKSAPRGRDSVRAKTENVQQVHLPVEERGESARHRAEYQEIIKGRIRDVKRYPRLASRKKWEGRVDVDFTVGRDGKLKDLALTGSSGHDLLDREALATVRRAQPFPPIPDFLEGNKIRASISLVFRLDQG